MMKEKKIFNVMFIMAVVAVLAWMVMGAVYVSVDQPTADTNYSGTMVINATIDNDTSQDNNATNATFSFYNATDGTLVYNVTILPENSNTNSTFNSTIATATFLPDGIYNLTVNMTNETSQSNATWENATMTTIQIDNTAPTVTINEPTTNAFLGSSTTSLVFNVTIIDGGVGIDTVNLSNSSVGGAYTYAEQSNDYWNLTIFNANLTEGSNTLTVWVNDTLNNINNSETVIVWLDTTVPTVDLVSPANWTWTDDTTPALTFNFTDDNSPNATCEIFVDGVTVATNSTVLNNTGAGITLSPSTALSSGNHTWGANCTDLGSNTAMSSGNYTLEVLNVSVTAPANATTYVTNTSINSTYFNFSLSSVLMNHSKTSSQTASCELFITNSTGSYLANGVNTTTVNDTVTVLQNNQSFFPNVASPNGITANWTVNCTWNTSTIAVNTGFYTLNVDNSTPSTPILTNPSKTTTSLTIDVATSSDVTSCTSTGSDTITQVSAGNWQFTRSSLSAGSTTAFVVTCTDAAGLSSAPSASTSFTTTASSSGGGSTGASGGISTGVTGQSAKEVWTSINKGETAKVPVKNGAIGVTEVTFDVSKTVYGAWLSVAKVDSFPSTVKAFNKKTYRKLDISKATTLKDSLITKAKISFKVEKVWLKSNGLTKENVALFRYNDGAWNQLNSVVIKDDGQYIHYSATTPGFSYFVIGERESPNVAEVATGEPIKEEVSSEEAAVGDEVAEDTTTDAGEVMAKKSVVWPWVVLVLLIIGALIWWWTSKK